MRTTFFQLTASALHGKVRPQSRVERAMAEFFAFVDAHDVDNQAAVLTVLRTSKTKKALEQDPTYVHAGVQYWNSERLEKLYPPARLVREQASGQPRSAYLSKMRTA